MRALAVFAWNAAVLVAWLLSVVAVTMFWCVVIAPYRLTRQLAARLGG